MVSVDPKRRPAARQAADRLGEVLAAETQPSRATSTPIGVRTRVASPRGAAALDALEGVTAKQVTRPGSPLDDELYEPPVRAREQPVGRAPRRSWWGALLAGVLAGVLGFVVALAIVGMRSEEVVEVTAEAPVGAPTPREAIRTVGAELADSRAVQACVSMHAADVPADGERYLALRVRAGPSAGPVTVSLDGLGDGRRAVSGSAVTISPAPEALSDCVSAAVATLPRVFSAAGDDVIYFVDLPIAPADPRHRLASAISDAISEDAGVRMCLAGFAQQAPELVAGGVEVTASVPVDRAEADVVLPEALAGSSLDACLDMAVRTADLPAAPFAVNVVRTLQP